MARFITRLQMELINDRTDDGSGLWKLTAPLMYQSDVAHRIFTVPTGTTSDLGSVPRLPFAYAWFGNIAQAPAYVHDFLYSTHLVSRAMADAVLREAMQATGVNWIRRWAWWMGVRLFGESHW